MQGAPEIVGLSPNGAVLRAALSWAASSDLLTMFGGFLHCAGMYIEQREQFLWKQVHLNWSTKYRLLNKMEMLWRFLPDPLGRKLSVKTRRSYLLHKIQLSPVAPYSWMTCHQKLPSSSGMQENCPFPFICTWRAHGACGNLLWSLLLFFFF